METKELTYKEALRLALEEEMIRDDSVILLGENIGSFGGASGVTLGLLEKFGPDRVLDTPTSESAIIGCAAGAAMTGMRPVVEMSTMDQASMTIGEIINVLSRSHYLSDGTLSLPSVIMLPSCVTSSGIQNGQTLSALFAAVPGLVIVEPSTPAEAKGLLKASIRNDNPVIFIQNLDLIDMKGVVPVDENYLLPLGNSYVEKSGQDVTIVSWGSSLVETIEAAADLKTNDDIDVEVVNPMTLNPMGMEPIYKSIKKTGHLIIVHDGNKTGGIGAEIAAKVMENDCFNYLESQLIRVSGLDVPVPYSDSLSSMILPQKEDIINAVYAVLDID